MIKHQTTREHYEKYAAMKKAAHVTLVGSTIFGTREELQAKYDRDPYLNNISLGCFDACYPYHRGKGVVTSLAENTCMYKHCIIYEILEMEPEFET